MQGIVVASTFLERCKGLLGAKRSNGWSAGTSGASSCGRSSCDRRSQSVMVLVPCRSIHTFGMKMNIDVLFADRYGNVLQSERNLARGQLRSCREARLVCEREADASLPWPEEGDRLSMAIVSKLQRVGEPPQREGESR